MWRVSASVAVTATHSGKHWISSSLSRELGKPRLNSWRGYMLIQTTTRQNWWLRRFRLMDWTSRRIWRRMIVYWGGREEQGLTRWSYIASLFSVGSGDWLYGQLTAPYHPWYKEYIFIPYHARKQPIGLLISMQNHGKPLETQAGEESRLLLLMIPPGLASQCVSS